MVRSRKARKAMGGSAGMTQEQIEDLLERLTVLQGKASALADRISQHEESLRAAARCTAAAAPLPRTA
jgi:hypothetical protein